MDVVVAAQNTVDTVKKRATVPDYFERIIASPRRSDRGTGLEHSVWMLQQIATGAVTGEKAHRWLGYAQGVLCEAGFINLQDAKQANYRS